MSRILAAISAAILATGLAFIGGASANASPPPPGASAWHYNTWIHDDSTANGCMNYTTVQHLQPIVYETTCSNANAFAVRDLTGTSWDPTDEYEIADNLLDYAVGFSGGHFKLETPSLPTDTTFSNGVINTNYQELDIAPSTNHNYPENSSEGTDLTVITMFGQDYTNEWTFCSSTWKTCTSTPNFG